MLAFTSRKYLLVTHKLQQGLKRGLMPKCQACLQASEEVYAMDSYVLCYECVKAGRLSELEPFNAIASPARSFQERAARP